MRVLQIVPSMHPNAGGISQGIRNIIPELEKLGLPNEVVCLDDPAEDFFSKDPFTITALGIAKGPWQYNAKLLPWLVDNLGRFDVIIVNALWLYHGYAFIKALKKYKAMQVSLGKPLQYPRFYIMPHGMLDPYFQNAPERKLKALRNRAYWKLIESKLVNTADGLLFTCKTELLLARESFRPYHPKREFNIGYGVQPPPPFDDKMQAAFLAKCPQVKDKPFILFLSRVHEKKGVDLLIKAYSALLEKTGLASLSPFPKLVIAGPGMETEYGKEIQQLAATSEALKASVYFTGMLAGDAKWGAFYTTEAFVLPSHQENFGIAVVEALACGKPVLISSQVNIWPEIMEANAGLVEDDTLEGTVKLLEAWLNLPVTDKNLLNSNAVKCYEDYFKIESAAKKFIEMLTLK